MSDKKKKARRPGKQERQDVVAFLNDTLNDPKYAYAFNVNPPVPYEDRTRMDRERLMDRIRPRVNKDIVKQIIRDNDILRGVYVDGVKYVPTTKNSIGNSYIQATDTIEVPIGVAEPGWEPGRDGAGGGSGQEGGSDPADLVYIPTDFEQLIEWILGNFDLPFLQRKDYSQTLVYTVKVRGIKSSGPESRLDWAATCRARLRRFRAMMNSHPEKMPPHLTIESIPTFPEFPLDEVDLKYKRVEEKWEPESKAVAFFALDRSGSMGGEALSMAKFYFLLTMLWLMSKYKDVAVVFIAHDAHAERVDNERDFYGIIDGGGTMFVPAFDLGLEIANREFPADKWNRYYFHGTDGYGFDPLTDITDAIERLIRGRFNFFGCLQVSPYGRSRSTPSLMAIRNVAEDVKPHVGFSEVSSMDEVPDAVRKVVEAEDAET